MDAVGQLRFSALGQTYFLAHDIGSMDDVVCGADAETGGGIFPDIFSVAAVISRSVVVGGVLPAADGGDNGIFSAPGQDFAGDHIDGSCRRYRILVDIFSRTELGRGSPDRGGYGMAGMAGIMPGDGISRNPGGMVGRLGKSAPVDFAVGTGEYRRNRRIMLPVAGAAGKCA